MPCDPDDQLHLVGKPAPYVALADVRLKIHGREFLAHSAVLGAHSQVLCELLIEFVHTQGLPAANSGSRSIEELPLLDLTTPLEQLAQGLSENFPPVGDLSTKEPLLLVLQPVGLSEL